MLELGTELASVSWSQVAFFLLLALGISFLCSLLEAVLLSANWTYIEKLAREGRSSGPLLRRFKEEIDAPLAAILTLNTVAHTVGAAGVGAQFYESGGNWLAAASIIMTLLILIFSEIIPKTIGATYWRQLATPSAHAIRWMVLLTWPAVVILQKFSRSISTNGAQPEMTREEMIAVAELGEDQGTLDKGETRVIRNLLTLDNIHAEDVMTPSTVMLTFQQSQTVAQVVEAHSPLPFSRIPVTDSGLDDVVGFVLRSRLMEAYGGNDSESPLGDLLQPLHSVGPEDSVSDLLDEFIARREHAFLVVDEYGTTQGLITLEDAVETLLGVEIVDESDSVEDMRQLARELWEKRQRRREVSQSAAGRPTR
ncbi:MAG: hemolysin family protein [Candidatus Poseidoniia archaeon]|jgi:CBS domain containing-hemolysin-like protein|nr:hemolysin family protein [Candidatus Poseidoniia archaeon]MDP6846897.1 hemolysin family protein [Candidatus Poseidoniia archaeon]MDP7007430.1 hemolysin family protein [Candidatus Poseidoniia archaeon]|tara:strand:+ start:2390 stop:3490 length:1101 start_codon:yes stop_codon:yes gene_type:complete